MATKLSKPVTRETDVRDPCFNKPLMIQIEGGVIRLWQKGTRRKFTLPIKDAWRHAYQAAARVAK